MADTKADLVAAALAQFIDDRGHDPEHRGEAPDHRAPAPLNREAKP